MTRTIAVAAAAMLLPHAAAAEPLELFNNRLFVPVAVNGVRTTALLDSGAEMTVLDDDFARRAGIVGTGSAEAHGSGQNVLRASFAENLRLDSGFFDVTTRGAILDLGEVATRLVGRDVDVIVGRDVFDRVPLRIDILSGSIERAAGAPRGVRLQMTNRRGIPAIPASAEGHPEVPAAFDLGNGSEVLISRAYAERIGLTRPERIVERRTGGGLGGALTRDIVLLRSLTVGGREFRDVPAAIDPGESASDLNLGTSILRHFIIVADFPNQAIWLEPRP